MRLATLADGTRDGRLVVVSKDHAQAAEASAVAPCLRAALERWDEVAPRLRELSDALEAHSAQACAFEPARCAAPLPRAPQWCDGSAFLNHGRLMQQAFGLSSIPDFDTIPVMYQGASDDFLGPHDDVPFVTEADGIDFEGEFGVVTDEVPMGTGPASALSHVRLIVQLNDWSLRALAGREMETGFGFFQSKPSTSFAPLAVTPDELGAAWDHGRVHLRLHVSWNGAWHGHPHGGAMDFDFGRLVAHAARTRRLAPGTIVGSGTVSNADRSAGSACIAEKRVLERLHDGGIRTGFMRFGDRVRMEARTASGEPGPFGVIDQRVVAAPPARRDA